MLVHQHNTNNTDAWLTRPVTVIKNTIIRTDFIMNNIKLVDTMVLISAETGKNSIIQIDFINNTIKLVDILVLI